MAIPVLPLWQGAHLSYMRQDFVMLAVRNSQGREALGQLSSACGLTVPVAPPADLGRAVVMQRPTREPVSIWNNGHQC